MERPAYLDERHQTRQRDNDLFKFVYDAYQKHPGLVDRSTSNMLNTVAEYPVERPISKGQRDWIIRAGRDQLDLVIPDELLPQEQTSTYDPNRTENIKKGG